MLYCHDIMICHDLRTFRRLWAKKKCSFGAKQCFLGKKCPITWLVMSCLLILLISCQNGHICLPQLCSAFKDVEIKRWVTHSLSQWLTTQAKYHKGKRGLTSCGKCLKCYVFFCESISIVKATSYCRTIIICRDHSVPSKSITHFNIGSNFTYLILIMK